MGMGGMGGGGPALPQVFEEDGEGGVGAGAGGESSTRAVGLDDGLLGDFADLGEKKFLAGAGGVGDADARLVKSSNASATSASRVSAEKLL